MFSAGRYERIHNPVPAFILELDVCGKIRTSSEFDQNLMATLTLPETAYPAVRALVDLTDSQFEDLLKRLADTPPALDLEKYVTAAVSSVTTLDSSTARLIIEEFLTMLFSGARSQMTSTKLASKLSEAALEAHSTAFPFTSDQRQLLESRLSMAFSTKGLQITGRAQSVYSDTDKQFAQARVLTDLRSVYDESGEEVSAAIVIHNLRIRYYENNDVKDTYLSLDSEDLVALINVLQRALKKETGLVKLIQKSGIPHLE
jgi:hypothetical protein